MQEIRRKLFELQDLDYQKFHSRLCPNTNGIIGVRIPELRKMAKQIANDNAKEYLTKEQKEYYEEKMLQGFVIGYMKGSLKEKLQYLDIFVPMIDNWAVCDCSISSFKFTQKNAEEVWQYLQKYTSSQKEFELRFLVIMLMDYYLLPEYLQSVFAIYNQIQSKEYYVQMGIAWAISVAFVKFPEETMVFLKNNQLDKFTYNKSLQKIIESNRIDKNTKQIIKEMKR